MPTRWKFDVPVGVEVEQCLPIKEIVALAMEYKRKSEFEAARILLIRSNSSPAAMLELAKLYRDTPQLQMDQRTRYRQAEALLLKLERAYDLAEICLELSELYRIVRKPLSSFGYLLRSRRLGADIPEKSINAIWQYLEKMDVNTTAASDSHGAYILGYEASLLEDKYNIAIWLLQEAVDNGSGSYPGISALRLSEIFEGQGNRALAKEYADRAAKNGNPPILTKTPA